MNETIRQLFIASTQTLHECIAIIDRTGKGIALVVDDDGRLLGTITDGDIRRAILVGVNLALPVQILIEQRKDTPFATPLTAPLGTPDTQLLHTMTELTVRHIPLVDEEGRVVDLALLGDLVKEYELPLRAIVMAGGYGTRLRPLTEELPKPMLPVGDRPLLELIVEQLRQAGIRQVNVATHYKGDLIAEHFRDGRDFGIDIRYVKEDQPLGTAGALSLLEHTDEPLLVMNGDILTRVDFRAMLNFHREQKAELTVAVRQHEFCIPYGVIDTDGVSVRGISEKPIMRHFINAGIYLLNPSVCRMIPTDQAYDIPELITRLLAEGRKIVSFPIREYWLDIGKTDHYHQAQTDVADGIF